MENFTYYTPTKVVFGKGTENQTGALVKEQHCKKVLIHYGSGSVVRSGLLDRIKTSLDEAAVSYVELGGVVPNPRLSLVYEGIELCKKENVDFILAVGGGSVIDSAKAIVTASTTAAMSGIFMILNVRQKAVFQSAQCLPLLLPEVK